MKIQTTSKREERGLLAGIRILDLADEKASFCSKLLADLGARVIKVEKPGGDPSRQIGPFLGNSPHPEKSLSFYFNNTNKLGITLDLGHSEARDILLKLVERADVIVESFPPGYLDNLGLGFETLRETNRGLILVSVTGFGQSGPSRDFKSCDLVASAFGGQMYVTGTRSGSPLKHYGEQSYFTSSLFAAVGILLALRRRAKDKKGEHLDISLQEAVTSTLEHVMVRYFYEKVVPERQGSVHWNGLFCILPCKDGFIHLTPLLHWETLIEWLDGEGMAEDLKDMKWKNEEYRANHLDRIIKVLERWTKTHTPGELFELGQLMGFPWAPVLSPKEITDSPHLKACGFFWPIAHPELDATLNYPRLPYLFSSRFPISQKRAPLIGENNADIYQKELGMNKEELRKLSSKNVI